jgi:hypothetical protein
VLRKALTPIAICVALACVAPGIANGQTGERLASSWAQVNICSPTQLGARAQLAGDGSKAQMSVTFTAQWLSPNGWVPLDGASSSPLLPAGSAEYTWGQAGWTYSLDVPASGHNYQLRAVAEMQWRDGTSVTPSETRVTGGCPVSG